VSVSASSLQRLPIRGARRPSTLRCLRLVASVRPCRRRVEPRSIEGSCSVRFRHGRRRRPGRARRRSRASRRPGSLTGLRRVLGDASGLVVTRNVPALIPGRRAATRAAADPPRRARSRPDSTRAARSAGRCVGRKPARGSGASPIQASASPRAVAPRVSPRRWASTRAGRPRSVADSSGPPWLRPLPTVFLASTTGRLGERRRGAGKADRPHDAESALRAYSLDRGRRPPAPHAGTFRVSANPVRTRTDVAAPRWVAPLLRDRVRRVERHVHGPPPATTAPSLGAVGGATSSMRSSNGQSVPVSSDVGSIGPPSSWSAAMGVSRTRHAEPSARDPGNRELAARQAAVRQHPDRLTATRLDRNRDGR
jgi:hypothetical protein